MSVIRWGTKKCPITMAPNIKLVYFPVKGRGELVRYKNRQIKMEFTRKPRKLQVGPARGGV